MLNACWTGVHEHCPDCESRPTPPNRAVPSPDSRKNWRYSRASGPSSGTRRGLTRALRIGPVTRHSFDLEAPIVACASLHALAWRTFTWHAAVSAGLSASFIGKQRLVGVPYPANLAAIARRRAASRSGAAAAARSSSSRASFLLALPSPAAMSVSGARRGGVVGGRTGPSGITNR